MLLYLIQAIITWILFGLILTVQVVHYPIFLFLNTVDAFKFHQVKISYLVMPLMLIELGTAVYLFIRDWTPFFVINGINLALVIMIWVITFTLMVPLHQRLTRIPEKKDIESLIKYNWLRTMAWMVKSLLWGGIIWHLIST